MKRPICILCRCDIKPETVVDEKGQQLEPQTLIWIHNPRNLHEDVQTPVHTACLEKVTSVYTKFGTSIEQYDMWTTMVPCIDSKGIVTIQSLKELLDARVI